MTPTPVRFTRNQVAQALHRFAPKMKQYLVDTQYFCLNEDEWNEVIKDIGSDPNKYVPEKYDCDSFSRYWWAEVNHRYEVNGMFTVIDFSGRHSYNAILVHDNTNEGLSVRLFEPQNGSQPEKGEEHYTLTSGFFI